LTDVREEALKKNVGVSEGCAVKDFRVTFWKDGHPTDFAILDADAQHAALRMGGLPCRVETGDGYVTWVFATAEARDHFIDMAWGFHHMRPLGPKNTN
jgi:hypothetical protein